MVEPGSALSPAETAAATIVRHRMLEPGDTVLAAFSGGADSTCLALLLHRLGYRVVLGHVDHQMRTSSAGDAEHCREVARTLGLSFLETKVRVTPPTQAEARRVRYLALAGMAAQCGAVRTATGHTADDQAETVLLRLDRGGYGLGIPPVRGELIRPLLDLRRRDTEAVCRQAGVGFRTDPSNRNLKYRRVVMRARLDGVSDEQLGRLTALAEGTRRQSQDVALSVDALWPGIVTVSESEVRIKREGLSRAEDPVRRQLVRRAAQQAGMELTGRAVNDVLRKVSTVTGARLDLPGGMSVWSDREEIVFGRDRQPPILPSVTLKLPGTTTLPGWGARLSLEFTPVPAGPVRNPDRYSELVDVACLTDGLAVRPWQPGDRFHPLGAPGSRKLQDFFVDAGLPRSARPAVPVVVCGDKIVWLAGHRLDDRFKIRPQTTQAVRMTYLANANEEVA